MDATVTVSALGALIGLVLSIILIFREVRPFYALFAGALVGGLLGGANLSETIQLMTEGSMGMMTSILRILAAGVLAGVLIKSGAAQVIAYGIVKALGEKRAMLALIISTAVLTFVGVFIDIAVITVSPIAIEIARQVGFTKTGILVAMIGGGKAGNVISPNPNTIVVSDGFGVPLVQLMLAGLLPAIVAILVTYLIASRIKDRGSKLDDSVERTDLPDQLPSMLQSLAGPILAIVLLILRPTLGIEIDPMLALPLGGLFGALVLGKINHFVEYINYGLEKMTGVAIILLGTGLIAGIITNSNLGQVIISAIDSLGLSPVFIAPISGILMSAATASTTSGSAVASAVFAETIIGAGIRPLNGGAMLHAGATVLDHLPHGSFFHATGGSVTMSFKERLALIPYESLIGLTITLVSLILYGFIF